MASHGELQEPNKETTTLEEPPISRSTSKLEEDIVLLVAAEELQEGPSCSITVSKSFDEMANYVYPDLKIVSSEKVEIPLEKQHDKTFPIPKKQQDKTSSTQRSLEPLKDIDLTDDTDISLRRQSVVLTSESETLSPTFEFTVASADQSSDNRNNEIDTHSPLLPESPVVVRPTITVTGAERIAPGIPKAETTLVAGDEHTATPSTLKIARIHEQLSTDSQGNVLHKVPMSDAGRYQSRKSIQGTGMFQVDDMVKKQAVVMRMKKQIDQMEEEGAFEDYEEDIGEELYDDTYNHPQRLDDDDDDDDEQEAGVKFLPAVTLNPEDMKNSETQKTKLSLKTIVNLKRMRNRIGGRIVTTKNFAKNEDHERLMVNHGKEVAREIPLPLRILLHDEAMQVVAGTVKIYTKILGKKHPLTVEAEDFLAKMKKKADDFTHA